MKINIGTGQVSFKLSYKWYSFQYAFVNYDKKKDILCKKIAIASDIAAGLKWHPSLLGKDVKPSKSDQTNQMNHLDF